MTGMRTASHLPTSGEVFLDARGDRRALRVSWHGEVGMVVLSLWREGACVGTFRLAAEEVPALVETLRAGFAQAYDDARESFLDRFGAVEDEAG